MLKTLFATKIGMTQAWSATGKRLAVTRLLVKPNAIVSKQEIIALNKDNDNPSPENCFVAEIGYGAKKLKNCTKPLQEKIKKSGFSSGFSQLKGLKLFFDESNKDEIDALLKVGEIFNLADILAVGDLIKVQGKTKGKGFAGVMKRHGFHGGPRTHGQSDRQRAPGAIGCRTDPGRVLKGKRMAGHMGDVLQTVSNLTILHLDLANNEIWVSGPVPGANNGLVRITKTGAKKIVELDKKASGIKEEVKIEEKPADDNQPAKATPALDNDAVVENSKEVQKS